MSYNTIYRRDLFRDHVIVVTGGGSGIGRCTGDELASLGACVAIMGNVLSSGQAGSAACRHSSRRVLRPPGHRH